MRRHDLRHVVIVVIGHADFCAVLQVRWRA